MGIGSEEEKWDLMGKISKECNHYDISVDWSGVIFPPKFLDKEGLEKYIDYIDRTAKSVISEAEKNKGDYNAHYVPLIKKISEHFCILELNADGLVKDFLQQ